MSLYVRYSVQDPMNNAVPPDTLFLRPKWPSLYVVIPLYVSLLPDFPLVSRLSRLRSLSLVLGQESCCAGFSQTHTAWKDPLASGMAPQEGLQSPLQKGSKSRGHFFLFGSLRFCAAFLQHVFRKTRAVLCSSQVLSCT